MSNIALAVIVNFDKVLIIRRKNESPEVPILLWAFPGGKTELGETFDQAVIRESAEETGLKVTVNSLICERVFPGTNNTLQYFHCQLCKGCDPTVIPNEDEIAEWKWVTGIEALDHFTSDVAQPIEIFLKQLAGYR